VIRFKGKVSFVEKNGKQYARASYAKDGKRHQVWRVVEQRKSDAKDAVVAEIERILNDTGETADKTFHDLAVYYEKTKAQPARFEHDQKVSGCQDLSPTATYHSTTRCALRGHASYARLVVTTPKRTKSVLLDRPVRHIEGGSVRLQRVRLLLLISTLRVLRAMLNKAEQNGWITRKVNFSGLIAHAAEAKRETYPSQAEFERILQACEKRQRLNHVRPIVLLIADTGARPVELWQLRWSDVDLPNANITYTSDKGVRRTRRTIPLTDRCVSELRLLPRMNDYVMGGIKSIKRAWKSIQKEAATDVDLYSLRHLFATRIDLMPISQNQKQKLMGHTSAAMFGRYAKLTDETVEDVRGWLNANPYLPVIDSEVVQ
jgi:integrase